MQLFPAIDILDGKAVRLARGDYNAVTVYNQDPLEQAFLFKDAGAQWIHLVDLNGARTGEPINHRIIHKIIDKTGLKVEVGGGVRSLETVAALAAVGAARIVIGTKLVTDTSFARNAVKEHGDLICAGVDARDGMVAIEGWLTGSAVPALRLISTLRDMGIQHLVYTDIARDGMQSGIDAQAYREVAATAGFAVTASGGISTLDDLRALRALGDDMVDSAITGRALYEGSFTLEEALAALV